MVVLPRTVPLSDPITCWHWKAFQGAGSFGGAYRSLFNSPELSVSPSGSFAHPYGTAVSRVASFPHLLLLGECDLAESGDLARALPLPAVKDASDATLILHAYASWGPRTPEHLEGRFSFAIWDDRTHQLYACRDHLGSLPFVYYVDGANFAFAGDMQTMLNGFRVPRVLNRPMLASCKVLWQYAPPPEETLFSGILSLPPGHHLTISRSGVRTQAYWKPEIRPECVPVRESEVYDKTVELVERAVQMRVAKRSAVGVMYSGGLDSSVAAVVTAGCLRKLNRSFVAFAAVNRADNTHILDERGFMLQLAHLDNMKLQYVSAEGQGPFDDIEDPSAFHTSCVRYSRFFLDNAMRTAAGALGIDVLLSGNFGESTISIKPRPYLLECARTMRWGTLRDELRGRSANTGHSALKIFASEAKSHVFPYVKRIESFWFTPDFAESYPPVRFPRPQLWPDTRKHHLSAVRNSLECDALVSTLTPDDCFAPTQLFKDRRLLEFCLSVPAKFKSRGGIGRYLLRRSFAHLLPAGITWRMDKFPYSPDYCVRYNEQVPKAATFLGAIRKSDPVRDIVDVERLKKSLSRVDPMMAWDSPALTSIPRSIYLIKFLRGFPAFRI
jgi:asparagine synthase (glutamine-hydrolysing)